MIRSVWKSVMRFEICVGDVDQNGKSWSTREFSLIT